MFAPLIHNAVRIVALLVLALLLLGGCKPSFDPLQENQNYHFSIYGYLDASADTQWVRVMPVRDSLLYSPRSIDAKVILKHLETGEKTILKDSLFQFAHNHYAWNYWTTENIKPSATYRLIAEYEDERSSQVTVELPKDFSTPKVHIRNGEGNLPDMIEVEDVQRLVDARVTYFTDDHEFSFSHLQDTARINPANYHILVDPDEDIESIRNRLGNWIQIPNEDKQIYIAAAESDYPSFSTLNDKVIALPEGVSNVEKGVGYVAGIISKTIPYKSCYDNEQDLTPCPLIR